MIVFTAINSSLFAGGVKYENEKGDYIKIGGRIQLQYHITDPDGGSSSDELLFRRLRPYIEGSLYEDWTGKIQFDLGKGTLALKDNYVKYTGFELLNIVVGNANFCFSRELLTSSKNQQLVERTFVGDHNYGTPDRQTGIHLNGSMLDDKLAWSLGVGKAALDPSNKKLDFDTIIQYDAGDDWLEGDLFGGRIEFFPMGSFKHSQGDFSRETKAAMAIAGFSWNNDNDNVNMNTDKVTGEETDVSHSDVDNVLGLEASAAFRSSGVSIDAQCNIFQSELVNGKSGADGLYEDGETTLVNYAIEGGYMVIPSTLELVAGYQNQDADGYDKSWNRYSVGANIFVNKHDIKYQLAYRMNENKDGKDGNDVNEFFLQAQYVF